MWVKPTHADNLISKHLDPKEGWECRHTPSHPRRPEDDGGVGERRVLDR